MYRWKIQENEMKWLNSFLCNLPKIINPNDVTILENPLIMVMAALISAENENENKSFQKEAAKYILSKLTTKAAELNDDDLMLGSKKYFLGINIAEKLAHIYMCIGCYKFC